MNIVDPAVYRNSSAFLDWPHFSSLPTVRNQIHSTETVKVINMLRSFWSLRPTGRRQRRALSREVQLLEVRQVPTGIVTLSLSSSGMNITGDVFDNHIQIDVLSTGSTIRATDNDTVIRVGKTLYPAGTTLPIDNDATFLGNLTINMNGGNDSLIVNVGSIDIAPSILSGGSNLMSTILGGDAPDALVQGNLKIDMGAGNDQLVLDVINGHINVTGNATIDLGSGDDSLVAAPLTQIFNGGNNLGNFGYLPGFFEGLPNVNTIHELVPAVIQEFGGVVVNGNIKITGGSGNDGVGLYAVEAGRDLIVDLGAGNDLFGAAIIGAGRNLDLNAGSGDDDAVLLFAAAGGKTTLNMGAGNDITLALFIESSRDVSVDMGAGDDVLLIGLLVTGPNAKTTLDGNSGRDVLSAQINGAGLKSEEIAPRTTAMNFESSVVPNDVLDQLGQDFQDFFFRNE
jgi:hypothetical protein